MTAGVLVAGLVLAAGVRLRDAVAVCLGRAGELWRAVFVSVGVATGRWYRYSANLAWRTSNA
ncbi:hypothetical protein D3C77_282340 [compost metagenome]